MKYPIHYPGLFQNFSFGTAPTSFLSCGLNNSGIVDITIP
jgi:hypothetical protein